ncbi:MAG: hypothetical protein FJW14_04765 [Acidimicrobiia bacterium]|nr:hypothetical protein [Acidimicrobiia bacterium]
MSADPLFAWLEASAFSIWMRESPSLWAFPGILAAHTVGLGLLAGLNGALDLRVLGVAPGVPTDAFRRYLPLMWLGLWMNVVSGIALVIAYPTKALTNPVFHLKLGLIVMSLLVLRATLRKPTKTLAVLSLAGWAAAITAGRLLAYTCSRLMVDEICT